MTRLAVVVGDIEEASECITLAVADLAQPIGEVTIISIASIPLLSYFAVQTGLTSSKQIAEDAARRAIQVAVKAIQMLPAGVHGRYILSRGWRDPAMRTHLLEWRYDELIVARRWFGIRGLRAHTTLRGTGVAVRSPHMAMSDTSDVGVGASVR